MGSNRPQSIDDEDRVVRFRPRMSVLRGFRRWKSPIKESVTDDSPVADLAKYESPESADDYRHRMFINAIVLVFTAILILAGVWLTNMMAHA
jgi:hypothetical protein